MAAFRFFDPNPVQWDNFGVLAAGGSLTFTLSGATTASSVYGEPDLSTDNGNVIALDAAGRPEVDVWMDSTIEYRVVLKDSDGDEIWTKDNVRDSGASSTAFPDPADGDNGQFCVTDGTTASWASILQVPDPTGASGKVLTNNGSTFSWLSLTAAAIYSETSLPGGITQSGADLQIGKLKFQTGTGTAPTASAEYTTKAITFSEAYASGPLIVLISPRTDNITPGNALVSWSVTSKSTTGFTVKFYAGQEHGNNNWFITSAIDFDYVAMGLVA